MSQPTTLTGPDLAAGIEATALKEGVPLLGHANGEAVMLVKTVTGVIRAVGASCSHYGGPLAEGLVVGETVRCPWHHACFDLRSGAVVRAPALNPVACYGVQADGGFVRITGKRPVVDSSGAVLPADGAQVPDASVRAIVIVGGGAAGHYAAESLRRYGYVGALTVLGKDVDAPYDRPNLSKDFLAGSAPEEWIPLRAPSFYEEQGIALETGAEVKAIDAGVREVQLVDGRRIAYDRLLLATGAEPVALSVPGGALPHVHLLRTLEDCRRVIAAASTARRVVIVGSGFIGLEAAAALRARKLEVTVVSPESEPLARVMGGAVGAFLRGLHQEHGVTFHLKETVSAIESDAVITKSGLRVPADLVLVGIGVRPALTLAEGAGLAVDRGVMVNEYLETSVSGIFAAGDVARFPDPRAGGTRIRVEHWVVAQRMGATAAANMLGARCRFEDVPFFWSVHYDVTLSYSGHTEATADALEVNIEGSLQARDCRVSYRDKGRLAAVLTIGRDGEGLAAERAFEVGTERE